MLDWPIKVLIALHHKPIPHPHPTRLCYAALHSTEEDLWRDVGQMENDVLNPSLQQLLGEPQASDLLQQSGCGNGWLGDAAGAGAVGAWARVEDRAVS